MRRRWFGLATLLGMLALAVPLFARRSLHASVLGRYSAAYFALLCAYGVALLAIAAICAGGERRYRAVFNKNLVLLLATTATVLISGELYLRERLAVEGRIKRFPPNSAMRMKTPEYDVEVRVNGEGFRDVDHHRRKPDGVTRIAVIGDSFVMGYGVEFADAMTSRLAERLRGAGHAAEVFNYGITGTGPVHYERVWERFARHYHPDIVVLAFYAGNDVSEALRESRAVVKLPRFALIHAVGRLLYGEAAAPVADLGWAAGREEHPLELAALVRRGRRLGVGEPVIRERLAALDDSLLAQARDLRINPFNVAEAVLEPDAMMRNLLLAPGPESGAGWAATESALDRIDAGVKRGGARLAILCIPAAPQLGRAYWWIANVGFRIDERVLREAPLQERLRGYAASREIPYLDLLPIMKARPDETLYFEQDGHWTETGNEVAADALSDALASLLANR